MNKLSSQKLVVVIVTIAFIMGLMGRWWLSKSTINVGTTHATKTLGPIYVAKKLSTAVSQFANATTFIVWWIDTDDRCTHSISYDRQAQTLTEISQEPGLSGGTSFSRVTDNKLHALAKSASPIWDLGKHGCPAAAWED